MFDNITTYMNTFTINTTFKTLYCHITNCNNNNNNNNNFVPNLIYYKLMTTVQDFQYSLNLFQIVLYYFLIQFQLI